MSGPINRTILVLDIEGSGRRSDVEVAVLRRMMYTVLRGTLAAASVEASEYRTEDRGDGAFVLIDPSVPKPQLIRALLTHTPERLYDSNRLASSSVQVRLRIVVHSGEVTLDEHGALGADVVEAFRLLDTRELRAALESTTEASVLCVSDAVHRGVVRHRHPGIRAEHFHRFVTEAKEGELAGWIHDPRRVGHAPSAERPSPVQPAPAHTPSAPADPQAPAMGGTLPAMRIGSGNFFFGTGAHIAGDAVAGHKYVGPPREDTEL
ncbi:hypothetical protein OHV13_13385 [Kitasatospora purpeofusca]|uniref:hypothetical protein n=1 Tax=Kitasatospora purpeofusca TaxID=67352 RepID=UPI002E1049FF|nr:hypothetical protein OG196_19610 [Kitasatospora purpeofusca]